MENKEKILYDFEDLYKITTHSKDSQGNEAKKIYEAVIEDENNITKYKVFAFEIYTNLNKKFAINYISSQLKWTSEMKQRIIWFISETTTRYIVILTDSENKIEEGKICHKKEDFKDFHKSLVTKFPNLIKEIEVSEDFLKIQENKTIEKKISRGVKAPKIEDKIEFLNKLQNSPEEAKLFITEMSTKKLPLSELNKSKTEIKVALNTLMKSLENTEEGTEKENLKKEILRIPYWFAMEYQKKLLRN